MVNQIKNARFYLQAKLGQRGAEMVEYAIVLACIAAVGVYFYSKGTGVAGNGLNSILSTLWDSVSKSVGSATGATSSSSAS